MNQPISRDTRIATLIAAYADGAPVAVDALAMARQAAQRQPSTVLPVRLALAQSGLGLGLVVLAIALSIAVVGGTAMVGGDPVEREPSDSLGVRQVIEPFGGMAPIGARPSGPESGELIVGFVGRFRGMRYHGMSLLADGRLVSTQDWHAGILVEQLLTPSGVELMRARVEEFATGVTPFSTLVENSPLRQTPGLDFGDISVRRKGNLVNITWADPELPRLLADPGSWLPAMAWRDARVSGFVPSRYRVCVEPSAALDGVPPRVRELVVTSGVALPQPAGKDRWCPYDVTLDDARNIVNALVQVGLVPDGPYPRFHLSRLPGRPKGFIEVLPVTPDGMAYCNCG
jgi:hypothetical protein